MILLNEINDIGDDVRRRQRLVSCFARLGQQQLVGSILIFSNLGFRI
jgi:hypothetical protein